MMADKVQRYDLAVGRHSDCSMEEWPDGDYVLYGDVAALHASLIDLIDKTQSCTSGLSVGECLDEIKRRLRK